MAILGVLPSYVSNITVEFEKSVVIVRFLLTLKRSIDARGSWAPSRKGILLEFSEPISVPGTIPKLIRQSLRRG